MSIHTVYVNSKGKDNLSRLKRYTGIKNWNTLCRWALCFSLSENSCPSPLDKSGEFEGLMTWKVFGGQYQELYLGLIKQRCKKDGLELIDETYAEQFRLHIHRGLAMLVEHDIVKDSSLQKYRSPYGLIDLAKRSMSKTDDSDKQMSLL